MDSKTLSVLEYPKVLERLKTFCDFSASMELALSLEPTDSYDLALTRLAETSEARKLFSIQNLGIGGAHDIRAAVDLAARFRLTLVGFARHGGSNVYTGEERIG